MLVFVSFSISMVALLGMAALAVDTGQLYPLNQDGYATESERNGSSTLDIR